MRVAKDHYWGQQVFRLRRVSVGTHSAMSRTELVSRAAGAVFLFPETSIRSLSGNIDDSTISISREQGACSKRRFHPVNEISPQGAQFAAVVGIDWGDKKHAWSLNPSGAIRGSAARSSILPRPSSLGPPCCRRAFTADPLRWPWSSHAAPWYSCSPGMHTCICIRSIRVPLRSFARRCILPAPRTIRVGDMLLELVLEQTIELICALAALHRTDPPGAASGKRRKLVNEKTRQVQRLTDKLKLYFRRCWAGSKRWICLVGALAGAGPRWKSCKKPGWST